MTILFNLNINNLLQREVNWRVRYVDIWKQCRICTVYTLNGTKRTENDDNILFPSNEHRRKIIHQTHIYLVFTSCFRLRPIQQQRQWQWQRHCTTSNYMWVSDERQKGKTCSERNGTKTRQRWRESSICHNGTNERKTVHTISNDSKYTHTHSHTLRSIRIERRVILPLSTKNSTALWVWGSLRFMNITKMNEWKRKLRWISWRGEWKRDGERKDKCKSIENAE